MADSSGSGRMERTASGWRSVSSDVSPNSSARSGQASTQTGCRRRRGGRGSRRTCCCVSGVRRYAVRGRGRPWCSSRSRCTWWHRARPAELVFMHGAGGAYAGAHGVVAVVARDGHVVGERVLRECPVDIGLPGAAFVVDDHAEGHVRSVVMVVLARYDAGSAPGAARIVVKEAPWHNAAFGRKRWKTKTILPRSPSIPRSRSGGAVRGEAPSLGKGAFVRRCEGAPCGALRVADGG